MRLDLRRMQDKNQQKKKKQKDWLVLTALRSALLIKIPKHLQTPKPARKKKCIYCKTVFICKKRRQENNIVRPYCLNAGDRRNPQSYNLQVVSTHTSHVCGQHSFGLPLGMYGIHRTHFDYVRLDLLSLVI